MIDNRVVGKKIAAMRQKRMLTQQQLAGMMNVSHQAVSKWESGQALPDIQTMLELTRFFGVTVEQLISNEQIESSKPEDAYAHGETSDTMDENPDTEQAQKEVSAMSIQQLLQMAPYMSRETVEEIVLEMDEKLTAMQIARIAPYIRPECVEKLIEKHRPELSWEALRKIAPFMRREAVDELARAIASGKENVKNVNDNINKTINDIGKTFDDIGRGVGKAVKKAIRFGETIIDEVSSALSDLSTEPVAEPVSAARSERATALRRRAFERALADEKWDWLAAHMRELDGDAEFKERIAARAREKGMCDWICQNLGAYADAENVDAAIEKGNWQWLGENAWEMDADMQMKIARAAAQKENWDWLKAHSDGLMLADCIEEIACTALEKGERALVKQLAENHMVPRQAARLAEKAYEASDFEMLDALLDYLEVDFFDQLLPKMAEKGEWMQMEGYIELAGAATIENLMEIALERGDFEAVDLLDPYLS